jgi:septal ring factor EnvC (AmiA/AmiB activator)
MDDLTPYVKSDGPLVLAGGAVAWFLTWLRSNRKDAYDRVTDATQKVIDSQNATIKTQSDRIVHLEGRIDQLTLTMGQAFTDGASTKAELAAAVTKLDAAYATIERLESEVADWRRRSHARLPEEQV